MQTCGVVVVEIELIFDALRVVLPAHRIRARCQIEHEAGQVRRGDTAALTVLRIEEEPHKVAAASARVGEAVVIAHAIANALGSAAAEQNEVEAVANLRVAQRFRRFRRGRDIADALITAIRHRCLRRRRSGYVV